MQQCLLIKTKDNREFFTHEHNLPQLVEFSKVFNAEISVVRVDDVQVLELAELAPMICDGTQKQEAHDYEIVELKIAGKPDRRKAIQNASRIRKYIEKELLNGKTVSMQNLKQRYAHYKLSDSCLCNHLGTVRRDLMKKGYRINKVGGGRYRMAR